MSRSSLRFARTSMVLGLCAASLAVLPLSAPVGAVATPGDAVEIPGDVGPTINPATPADQNILEGATATLTVQTTAGTPPLSYQWYQGVAPDITTPVGTDAVSYTTPALTETTSYWVRVSNAIDAADSRTATVTVLSASFIHDIQGAFHTSPLAGQPVAGVTGIVTGLRSNGFYLQEPLSDWDANDLTSEGILVFTSSAPVVALGDAVSVSGTVTEFRPAPTNLAITEITSPTVSVLSTGNALPPLTSIGGAAEGNLRQPPLAVIDEDAVAPGEEGGTVEDLDSVFGPTNDGIDFYETLEGMRVTVTDPQAVSRTTDFGATSHEIGIVPGDFAAAGTRTPRGGILYEGYDQDNPEMLVLADSPRVNGVSNLPSVDVGDSWSGEVVGIIDYAFDNPLLLLSNPLPTFVDGELESETTTLAGGGSGQLTIGTYNVENLFSTDSPAKFAAIADQVVDRLLSPDILVIEEIQDNDGAATPSPTAADQTWANLIAAISATGGPTYSYRQIDPTAGADGGEAGGNIRVGFLFRPDRGVAFVDRPGGTATAANTVVDVAGAPQLQFSPGRIDPTNAAFNSSRKPLVGELTFGGETFFVVGNHWNSKGGDQPRYGRFQPPNRSSEVQRLQQAAIVEAFVDDITAIDPAANVVVAGDLNDYVFSPAVQMLTNNGYTSLVTTLPANERYGYVFDGNSQILDHILASPGAADGAEFDTVHVNSEFYVQQSDHDPSVARFTLDSDPPVGPDATAAAVCVAGTPVIRVTLSNTAAPGSPSFTFAVTAPAAGLQPAFAQTDIVVAAGGSTTVDVPVDENGTRTVTVSGTDFSESFTRSGNCVADPVPDATGAVVCQSGAGLLRITLTNANGAGGEPVTFHLSAPAANGKPALEQDATVTGGAADVVDVPVTEDTSRTVTVTAPGMPEATLSGTVNCAGPDPSVVLTLTDDCAVRSGTTGVRVTGTNDGLEPVMVTIDGVTRKVKEGGGTRTWFVAVAEGATGVTIAATSSGGDIAPLADVSRDCQSPSLSLTNDCAVQRGITGVIVTVSNSGPEQTRVTIDGVTKKVKESGESRTWFVAVADGATVTIAATSPGNTIAPLTDVSRGC